MLRAIDHLRRPLAPQRPYDTTIPGREGAGGPRQRLGAAVARATALSAGPKRLPFRAIDLGAGALLGGLLGAARREGRFEGAAVAGVALWVLGDEFLLPLVSMSGEPWRYSVTHQLYRMARRAAVAGLAAALYGRVRGR